MALAYAYNEWKPYNPVERSVQAYPYLASRRACNGAGITSIAVVPHKPVPEAFGTVQQAQYGDEPPITRIEGQGHGNLPILIDEGTERAIINSPDGRVDELIYKAGMGPVSVRVIDPLRVPAAEFELRFVNMTADDVPTSRWVLTDLSTGDSVTSQRSIAVAEDQLIPQWGL